MAETTIVDCRAFVEVVFSTSAQRKCDTGFSYNLNAQVELRADQINASAAIYQRPLVRSNATLYGLLNGGSVAAARKETKFDTGEQESTECANDHGGHRIIIRVRGF
ncbi:MAG: hypothetical protein V4550_18175 [Gemmatimonadota bacterium]